MTANQLHKYPRLYINQPLEENEKISLGTDQTHYLKNVMRKGSGDSICLFNGQDGEWLATIEELGKKSGTLISVQNVKEQPKPKAPLHLYFAPIKKQRLDLLIEKAVELGVQQLHPVITNRTENRKLNQQRMEAHMIEASEQCGRLDVPTLFPAQKLSDLLQKVKPFESEVPFYVCLEREGEKKPISSYSFDKGAAFLTGPEGGFDDQETAMITSLSGVNRVSLGETILRAETAVTVCLSFARLSTAS